MVAIWRPTPGSIRWAKQQLAASNAAMPTDICFRVSCMFNSLQRQAQQKPCFLPIAANRAFAHDQERGDLIFGQTGEIG
jgi:hypothetical protein